MGTCFKNLETPKPSYIWAYFLFGIPWDFMVPNVVASQNLMCVETLNLLQVVGQKIGNIPPTGG